MKKAVNALIYLTMERSHLLPFLCYTVGKI